MKFNSIKALNTEVSFNNKIRHKFLSNTGNEPSSNCTFFYILLVSSSFNFFSLNMANQALPNKIIWF